MTTIHIDGFEEFAGEQFPASALQRADYSATGNWTLVQGRLSGAALAGQQAILSRKLAWTEAKFGVGFSHQFNARGSACMLTIGTETVVLWMNPDTGLPNLNGVMGGALPTSNRWYYYELEIDRAAGLVNLYINNRLDATLALASAPTTVQEVTLTLGYQNPATYRPGVTPVPTDTALKSYDDFYMLDGARLGPIAVTTRFPTVDKNVEWFAADPSKSHAVSLSQHPPQPLDGYVASSQVGQEDRFTSDQVLTNANPVVASGLVVLARKSPQLSAKLGVFVGGQPGAALREATRDVGNEWRAQYVFFDKNVTDTVSGITAADFGFTVQPY